MEVAIAQDMSAMKEASMPVQERSGEDEVERGKELGEVESGNKKGP